MTQRRDETTQVKINVRMREALRAEIERDAEAKNVSMNAAIVDRLEASFRNDLVASVIRDLANFLRSAADRMEGLEPHDGAPKK